MVAAGGVVKSVRQWLAAEKFIYDWMPVLLVVGLISFGVLVFVLLYVKKVKWRWKYYLVGLLVFVLLGLGVFVKNNHQKYAWYNQTKNNITPAIRDREKGLFSYQFRAKQAPKVYDQEKIEALALYDKAPLVEKDKITYLGQTEYLYYFKVYNKLYKLNKTADFLVFNAEVDTPQFVGFNYTLKDKRYQTIGFYENIGPLYTHLEIPQEEASKTYDHQSGETTNYSY